MNSERGSVLSVLVAVLLAVAILQSVLLFTLSRRVSELESAGTAGARAGPAPIALGEEVQALRDRVDEVARKQEAGEKEVQRRLSAVERTAEAVRALPPGEGGKSVGLSELEDAVARAVDRKLEEELPRSEDGEWKPSLEQFREKLKLNEYQALQSEKILDDAKAELFKLAGLKREDGSSKLDDLVAAVTDPVDAEAATRQWFMSLFRDKIPGRDEAYIVEILRIRDRTEKSLVAILEPDQAKKMKRLNVDYLGVKTNYDPFAEYVQEALK